MEPGDRHCKGQSTRQVHHQRQPRIFPRDVGLRVANQQERAERGDFPEKEEPEQVVGKDEAEHRAHEHEQKREEQRAAVRDVGVRNLMILPHVTQGIEANPAPDNPVNQRHNNGKLVHEDFVPAVQGSSRRPLESGHHRALDEHQGHDQPMPGPQTHQST